MTRLNSVKKPLVLSMLMLLAIAMFSTFSAANAAVQMGTTLTATVTATGYWQQLCVYDWSITKSMTPTSLEINRGHSGQLFASITATRQVTEINTYSVRGIITVTNNGYLMTQNLKIVDTMQQKTTGGQFQDLAGATITITPPEQLAPSETKSYPYEIQFTHIQGATYRNTVKVTITNYIGNFGVEFGPETHEDFSLPTTPAVTSVDASAHVTDTAICPTGFSYIASNAGPWDFTASTTVQYTIDISNVGAAYSQNYQLTNTATLMESDTQQTRTATASVTIYSGAGQKVAPLTIGYWKNHAGNSGNKQDAVSKLLPIWLGTSGSAKSIQVTSASQAVQILEMKTYGSASNGVTKLYAQLLAAKLNQANGADISKIANTISQADAFLANNNWQSWSNLSAQTKNTVLGWMTTLDNYNNGLIS